MTKRKLTPWFPGDVKPVREGVYQRMYSDGAFYSKWHCGCWYLGNSSEESANITRQVSGMPLLPWRGLAKDPS